MTGCNNFGESAGVSFILAFTSGILLSPFSAGLIFLLFFILLFELITAVNTRLRHPWSVEMRALIIFGALLGFIIGRTVIQDKDPFQGFYNKNMFNKKIIEHFPHLDPDNERKKKVKQKHKN